MSEVAEQALTKVSEATLTKFKEDHLLMPKQIKFIDGFVNECLSVEEALRRAGYANPQLKKTQKDVLNHPRVGSKILNLLQQRYEALDASFDYKVNLLVKTAERCLNDVISLNGDIIVKCVQELNRMHGTTTDSTSIRTQVNINIEESLKLIEESRLPY